MRKLILALATAGALGGMTLPALAWEEDDYERRYYRHYYDRDYYRPDYRYRYDYRRDRDYQDEARSYRRWWWRHHHHHDYDRPYHRHYY